MKPYLTPKKKTFLCDVPELAQKGKSCTCCAKAKRKPKYQTAARKAVLRAAKKAMRRELNKDTNL